jgi:hypothetical protein
VKQRSKFKRHAAQAHDAAPANEKVSRATTQTVAPIHPARSISAPSRYRLIWRGVALDLSVVAAQLFLLAPLARVLREGGQNFLAGKKGVAGIVSPTVGWLFLSVFAAHALGAYLKRLPRQARLSARADGRQGVESLGGWSLSQKVLTGVACALLLAHFVTFMSLLFSGWQSTGLESWSPLFGESPAQNTYAAFFVRFVLIIFVMPLPTALVAISLSTDAGAPLLQTWRAHWMMELFADLLLYYSIIVVTLVMNVLIAPRFVADGSAKGLGDVLASLVPLALAFSIFYLPPRLVYLAEDYRSPLAWATILLALLALAYRTFFPDASSW